MIGIIGINHQSAPVTVRERVAFSQEEVAGFLQILKEESIVLEAVMLSTCNRLEIYFSAARDCGGNIFHTIIEKIVRFKNCFGTAESYFYQLSGENAVTHLLEVAGGLDSMVIGENQVLGQVKNAYKISTEIQFTSTVLNKLFHKAFEVGKKIRTETSINKGASSVSYASVELALKLFSSLSGHPVLLIGAGETGALVLQSLVKRGCDEIFIANRSFERASALAALYNATPIPFEHINEFYPRCDIVISSTASTEPVVLHRHVAEAMVSRGGREMIFIDLAVPRDMEEEIGRIEGVSLYNIDHLESVVSENYEKRKQEVEMAREMVAGGVSEFMSWHSGLKLSPVIDSLRGKLDALASTELRNLKGRLPDEEFLRLREFSEILCKKYQGLVVKNLKELSENGTKVKYIDFVNRLFDLESPENNK